MSEQSSEFESPECFEVIRDCRMEGLVIPLRSAAQSIRQQAREHHWERQCWRTSQVKYQRILPKAKPELDADEEEHAWLRVVALNDDFVEDIFWPQKRTYVLSHRQLINMWKAGNDIFQLSTPIESVPLHSLKSLRLVFSELDWKHGRQKVCRVRLVGDSRTKYIFKTVECQSDGWKTLYHELRQLLCMPRHPNILGPPEGLVYMHLGNIEVVDMAGDVLNGEIRLPICGFLLQEVQGITLYEELKHCYKPAHETETCRCFRGAARERLIAKWCRQLAETQLHILHHGNGLNRPGIYTDLKPNNIMITHSGRDIVLIDFESNGNWRDYRAPETHEFPHDDSISADFCRDCSRMGITAKSYKYYPDNDDVYRSSTPPNYDTDLHGWPKYGLSMAHLNKCPTHWNNSHTNPKTRPNVPRPLYSNPPWGYYYYFWTEATHREKEKAMVHSLCANCHQLVRGGLFPFWDELQGYFNYPIEKRLRKELYQAFPSDRSTLQEMLNEFKLWEAAAIERELDAQASARLKAILAKFRATQQRKNRARLLDEPKVVEGQRKKETL
ncbi:hypothetical protein FN846DRAFT_1024556 [Sphaerosporella brunnea]|uniref:Protein kinase domain-containing protein n=1 Tax=Sphaerosporella brunnea TaxID=1250544 RepID=A0A5J5EK13_9PEZI|nr:hypothetical protein FN846DRAFT_1024556 [Sphaerosporella brunnea]